VTDHSRRTAPAGPARRTLLQQAALVLTVGLVTAGCAASAAGSSDPGAAKTTGTGRTASAAPRQTPAGGGPTSSTRTARPLAGKIVGVDPGHNGLNYTDPAFLDRQIWNGREWENCNTTGTQTASGYTEAQFNFNVAMYLAADLRRDGARVVLTRTNNHGIGPCVTRRIQIIDQAHADVGIEIHADGGPTWGRGFTVLEPVADGPNDRVIAASVRFGSDVRSALLADSPMQMSNYYGSNGIIFRNNLTGLNLTTVPNVLIECGNMASAANARLLTSPAVQRQIARALEAAIIRFLTGS